MAHPKPVSMSQGPLVLLLLVLSITTGLVDAASVLGLGKVFTANMTGNVVFLGFALAGAGEFHVLPCLIALGSFFLGAMGAGRIGTFGRNRPLRQWVLTVATLEAGLLFAGAVLGSEHGPHQPLPHDRMMLIIAMTGAAMGIRNASIRQLRVADLTTTVLTLTLTGIAADSMLAGGQSPNLFRRVASVAAILVGAYIGARIVLVVGISPALWLAGAMVIFATVLIASHPDTSRPYHAA